MPRFLLPLLAAALLLAGCDGTPLGGLAPTARLQTAGPAVFVNGQPARDGQRLLEGDQLRTGADSAARIYWSTGQWLQVNPNSDPVWHWDEDSGTLQVNVLFGAFYIDTRGRKVRVEHPLASSLWGSEGAIYATRGTRFTAHLVEGRMRVLRPEAREVAPGQTAIVTADRRVTVRATTGGEAGSIARDFGRWAGLLVPAAPGGGSEPVGGDSGDQDGGGRGYNSP